jgi:hypothetical protein
MRKIILTLALALVAPVSAQAQNPVWESDYATAQQKAAAAQKPLAVVVGPGANGWQQLGGGSIPDQASRILADRYVTCFVDTSMPSGLALARAFDMDGSVGIVISDRTGKLQAFWHQGPLGADALTSYLARYGDPNRVVTTTDRTPAEPRYSNYPPTATYAPGGYAPVMGFSGGGACRG